MKAQGRTCPKSLQGAYLKILVNDPVGSRRGRLIKGVLGASLKALGKVDTEVSVLVTDDGGIRELNRRFRRIDRPTDVLSFPLNDPALLGDIVISVERLKDQALEFRVSVEEELARLLVHGLLHLLGYDHVRGGKKAREMKEREEGLMKGLRRGGLIEASPRGRRSPLRRAG